MDDSKHGTKHGRDYSDSSEENDRLSKAKRHDIEIPSADVDVKLAEMLDNILNLNLNSSKPRFMTNQISKTKPSTKEVQTSNLKSDTHMDVISETDAPKGRRLVSRNLTKEQIRDRVSRYDYLVQSSKAQVKVVKVLSAKESVELGREQAKRQLNRELELSSVTKNLEAIKEDAYRKFRFNDGYEKPMKDSG